MTIILDKEVEALAFPRTYTGGGSATWSLSWTNGSCLVDGDTVELTLNADGSLTGLYGRTATSFTTRTPPGAARATSECGDQRFPYDPIDVTGQHTPPNRVKRGEAGTVAFEIVVWPEWHIEGTYTPRGEMTFTGDVSIVATGYDGDAPYSRVIRTVDYRLVLASEG